MIAVETVIGKAVQEILRKLNRAAEAEVVVAEEVEAAAVRLFLFPSTKPMVKSSNF